MITEANVTVFVSDLEKSVNFYTKLLGLKLRRRVNNHWAEVEAPGLTIGLHPPGEGEREPGKTGSMSIGLTADNLQATVAEFRARGVDIPYYVVEDRPVKLVWFRDPDNNPLYLTETGGE
jgi:lactoylglutathione lyase